MQSALDNAIQSEYLDGLLPADVLHGAAAAHVEQVGLQVLGALALLTRHQEQGAAVRVGEDSHILQDLVAQRPNLQVVTDVLDELQHEFGLIQALQVRPGFFPDLSRQLRPPGRLGEEGRGAVHRGDPRLGQPALLELLGGDLADGGGGPGGRAGATAAGGQGPEQPGAPSGSSVETTITQVQCKARRLSWKWSG